MLKKYKANNRSEEPAISITELNQRLKLQRMIILSFNQGLPETPLLEKGILAYFKILADGVSIGTDIPPICLSVSADVETWDKLQEVGIETLCPYIQKLELHVNMTTIKNIPYIIDCFFYSMTTLDNIQFVYDSEYLPNQSVIVDSIYFRRKGTESLCLYLSGRSDKNPLLQFGFTKLVVKAEQFLQLSKTLISSSSRLEFNIYEQIPIQCFTFLVDQLKQKQLFFQKLNLRFDTCISTKNLSSLKLILKELNVGSITTRNGLFIFPL